MFGETIVLLRGLLSISNQGAAVVIEMLFFFFLFLVVVICFKYKLTFLSCNFDDKENLVNGPCMVHVCEKSFKGNFDGGGNDLSYFFEMANFILVE